MPPSSVTTLNTATLDRLGVQIPPDAPEITLRTAGGPRVARLVLIERIWVGGFAVEGVTVSVCESCADAQPSGLLGLNVSGHFLVTVDQARNEIALAPRKNVTDQTANISPWLTVKGTATQWHDGRVEVKIHADNRSDRSVRDATVEMRCEKSYQIPLGPIPAREETETQISLPLGTNCATYSLRLSKANW